MTAKTAKTKRIMAAMLAASLVLPALPMAQLGELAVTAAEAVAVAASEAKVSEGLEFESNGDGTCTVTGIGTCTDTALVIPSTAPNGDVVTAIGDSAFVGYDQWGCPLHCATVRSVVIPNSVTEIGYYAFSQCKNLTGITIPNSVTYIGYRAFFGCESLTSVTIPESVTDIDSDVFARCTGLVNLTVSEGNPLYHSAGNCVIETERKAVVIGCKNSVIPTDSSVQIIGYGAFSSCTSLRQITIPDNVTSIGGSAFKDTGLQQITIPDSVRTIGDGAFSGCAGLKSITISDNVTSIGSKAFEGTAYYKDPRNWTDDVLYIGNHLIEANKSVSGSYEVKAGTKSIADNAFYNCRGLTGITVPEGVTSIGSVAFSGCDYLKEITLPSTVTSIGRSALYMTAYHRNGDNWTDGVLYINDCLIAANTSVSGNYTVKAGTQMIADGAFDGCEKLTGIVIPDSVTSIGWSVFYNCTALTSVRIINPECSIEDESIPSAVTVYGHAGSTAQTYAEANGNPFVEIEAALPGDVDGSGAFDLLDVLLMQQSLAGWEVELDSDAGDVNDDGAADLLDVLLMQQALAGWDVELK